MGPVTDGDTTENDLETIPSGTLDPASIVLASTASKIRTFLYEVAEGTTNYRSLHSLTQQVEHQYHGRFLVELIQNAHDALFPEIGGGHGRIEIVMVDDDGPHGALYVANDGTPFSESNFASLSQLGQSDKDPQKSIGNKGIGFRSVLEITDSPQIFSRLQENSARFDGMCFGFSPNVLTDLSGPVLELASTGISPVSPFGSAPLVDWDTKLIAKFQNSSARRGPEWLKRELSYLSPYLLPVPINTRDAHTQLLNLERESFATVVRLPLKTEAARALVKVTIAQLPADTVLFLDRASSLALDCEGTRRQLTRVAIRYVASNMGRETVTISTGEEGPRESYLIWKRELEVANGSEEFRNAIADLPGKWPELRVARISLAVRTGELPTDGLFSIFLPTLVGSGSATHVNAPFFADMSRTDIDFEKQAYNRGLLGEAWKFAISIVRDELAGGDKTAAGAIVDLLAPVGKNVAAQRWRSGIEAQLRQEGIDLAEQYWFVADSGWSMLSEASFLPFVPDARIFTAALLRSHATFSVFGQCMNSRMQQLTFLADMAGYGVFPSVASMAETIEAVAWVVHAGENGDWNAFWRETALLLSGDAKHLLDRRVLLGTDGQLHAAGQDCALFFIPRQGAGEDDDVLNESAIVDIPQRLRPHVAFLHNSISLYEPHNLRQQTPTRKFLEKTLVNRFRVQDIFVEVLIKRTPKLPVGIKSPESEICADILQWGLNLLSNLVGRGRGDRTGRMLEGLALPCRGGWFTANTTSYGPGWPLTLGTVLHKYLSGANTADSRDAAKRLLLPPKHPLWRDAGSKHRELLDTAGVASGLRLACIEPSEWKSTFMGSFGAFELPTEAPPCFSPKVWSDYKEWVRSTAKPIYTGYFQYQMQSLYALPGISEFDRFEESTKLSFMDLVLNSMSGWPQGWDKSECRKVSGSYGPVFCQSPLWYALHLTHWIRVRSRDQESWHIPSERWHVPAKVMRTREWQFEHLHPLPPTVANMLDLDSSLASAMVGLGMPQYDPEAKSASTRLLDALAAAVQTSEIRDDNVFLGQVRGAWASFVPDATQKFPAQLLVKGAGRRLSAITPTIDGPVYLPDSSRSSLAALDQFNIPVLAIEASDAKRLASSLVASYRGAVVQTSALRLVPLSNGNEWTPGIANGLQESGLEWIAPLALTLAAHYGVNPRGTGSQRFAEQVRALREVRVHWCTTLAIALFSGEKKLPELSTSAMWMADSKTLLSTRACSTNPRLLSEAIAGILEREDLEVPLKLLLGETEKESAPEQIRAALNELRLSEGQLMEVREQWSGSLSYVIELLIPLTMLLQPRNRTDRLLEVQSEDQLLEFFESCRDPLMDGKALIRLAREYPDPYDFGLECNRKFDDEVDLRRWNEALVKNGGRALQNRQASTEFDAQTSQAKQSLRSLLAFAMRNSVHNRSFRDLLSELEAIACPANFADTLFEVRFDDAMTAYIEFFRNLDTPDAVLLLLSNCDAPIILLNRLSDAGVDIECDPVQLARDNRERLRQALAKMQQLGLAWAVTNDPAYASAWEGSPEHFLNALEPAVGTDAYLRPWEEKDIVSLLRSLPHSNHGNAFWNALGRSETLSELQQNLGVSAEAITQATGKLSELKEAARRRSKLVEVCGREFDGSEDNFGALWSHICGSIPEDALPALSAIDLSKPLKLASVLPKRTSGGGGGGGGSHPIAPRLSKAIEMLIGMAGEIHAFRRLQAEYGANVVTSSAWISMIGVSVFPENVSFADDGAGCDFRFMAGDRMFFVEVKSSSGTDETFTLGSSEIRLAMDLARAKRRKRRERFVILRVMNAMSAKPAFQVLPNPYDERFQGFYSIVEAGARVRYRLH
jgi:hypothetical protein